MTTLTDKQMAGIIRLVEPGFVAPQFTDEYLLGFFEDYVLVIKETLKEIERREALP